MTFHNTNMESFMLKAINPKIFPYYMLVFQITYYFFIYQTITGQKRHLYNVRHNVGLYFYF